MLHHIEGTEILNTLGYALKAGKALARLILLDAKPLCVADDRSLYDGRDIHLAHSKRTVLEPTAIILHGIVCGDTDESIRSRAQLALKLVILAMDHRNGTGILRENLDRVESGIIRPADIKLGLEVAAVVGAEEIIITDSAVSKLHEFEIVVVIKELETCRLDLCTDFAEFGHSGLELLGIDSGTARLIHIREDDILHAEDCVISDDLVDIVDHLLERNMVGERDETELGAHLLDLDSRVSVELTVKLDTGITHLADSLESPVEILLKIGAHAVKLNSYREFPDCTMVAATFLMFTASVVLAAAL